MKSGTISGFSTGGGLLGEINGYTPGMGGSDGGDGNGTKVYGVIGSSDGRGWVRAVPVVDIRELGGRELNEEVIEDEIPLPEGDKLVGLDDGTVDGWDGRDNGADDEGEDGNDGAPKGADKEGDGAADVCKGKGSEGQDEAIAKLCPAASRTRRMDRCMDAQVKRAHQRVKKKKRGR